MDSYQRSSPAVDRQVTRIQITSAADIRVATDRTYTHLGVPLWWKGEDGQEAYMYWHDSYNQPTFAIIGDDRYFCVSYNELRSGRYDIEIDSASAADRARMTYRVVRHVQRFAHSPERRSDRSQSPPRRPARAVTYPVQTSSHLAAWNQVIRNSLRR